jgi:hypothetical protein
MCNPEYEKLVNDPVLDSLRDRVIKIVDIQQIIAKHNQLVAEGFNKMRVVIDGDPLEDIKPDHVVEL